MLQKPQAVDASGLPFSFCPGKATWYPGVVQAFGACRIALETGILPEAGSLADQDQLFVDVFPTFVERWKSRTYEKVWNDVRKFTKSVLEAVFKKN